MERLARLLANSKGLIAFVFLGLSAFFVFRVQYLFLKDQRVLVFPSNFEKRFIFLVIAFFIQAVKMYLFSLKWRQPSLDDNKSTLYIGQMCTVLSHLECKKCPIILYC